MIVGANIQCWTQWCVGQHKIELVHRQVSEQIARRCFLANESHGFLHLQQRLQHALGEQFGHHHRNANRQCECLAMYALLLNDCSSSPMRNISSA